MLACAQYEDVVQNDMHYLVYSYVSLERGFKSVCGLDTTLSRSQRKTDSGDCLLATCSG